MTEESRFARYDRENRDKRRAYEDRRRDSHRVKMRVEMQKKRGTKRFVSWDGEGSQVPDGEPQPYILFGNSDGQYVKSRRLQTAQCLNLILQAPKDAINFGFAFNYDVNQILCDLPYGALHALAKTGRCRWSGYSIEHVPNKWFKVGRVGVAGSSRKIFDVFTYFNQALADVLDKYGIGTPEERAYLRQEKENRPTFKWTEIKEVIKYWKLEGRLMVELMEYMRKLFNDAGFFPTSWHGPGALARQMLKNHKIKDCKLDTRELVPEVWEASRYAFQAGRFQQWLAGLYEGEVYNYDIHSAYPYAIQFLPNLATGKWSHNHRVDRSKIRASRFCLYHIRYDARPHEDRDGGYFRKRRPRPLFRRLKNDNVFWPDNVQGWYWSPEAELVKDDPAAEFVESWEFEDDGSRPLAFIADIYTKREYHKALGNAIEYAFKLAMNSCYGQFAQRAGWRNQRPPGPPPMHQLEYAGFITSMCRAMVHRVASYAYAKGGLITIDTDGIYTTVQIPDHILPNGIGDGLGQWEESKYESILIWQNGFYWLMKDGEWSKARSRGAPRGKVPIDAAWEAFDRMDNWQDYDRDDFGMIRYDKKIFVGYKLALNQWGMKWRSWSVEPHKVAFGGGSGSKMQHIGRPGSHHGFCMTCIGLWDHPMHNLEPRKPAHGEYTGRYPDNWSYKHNLPWLRMDDRTAEEIDDESLLEIYEKIGL